MRVGSVPYVNALPLIAGLSPADVVLKPPSELPALLDRGEVVAVLASSFEALRDPTRRAVRGVGIATDGPAESVRLFSKVPFDRIKSLALDRSSLTSNHLARILLAEAYDNRPEARPEFPDLEEMLRHHDAALLIGDLGMTTSGDGLYVMDLGEAWTQLTGLPFVWALWIGSDELDQESAEKLQESARAGIEAIEKSIEEAQRRGWPRADAERYLSQTMHYRLTDRYEQGLALYSKKLSEHGFIREARLPSWVEGLAGHGDDAASPGQG